MGTRSSSDPFAVFVTYDEAKSTCEDAGYRLCTLEEMMEEGR